MKKRILSLLLCLVLCLSLMPTMAFATEPTKYNDGGGDGSSSDPWQISTLDQLNDLADAVNGEGSYAGSGANNMNDKYFKLTADIGSASEPFTKVIGKDRSDEQPHFSGNFDGDGHYVWLNIIKEDSSASNMYVGMFVLQNARISNLTVKGTVNAKNTNSNDSGVHVGGIAGTDIYSTFNYCRSECIVTAEKAGSSGDTIAGGICGVSTSNTFVNCSSSGSVTAKGGQNAVAGGITGTIGTKVKNSFSDATVTASGASNNYAGGIVGYYYVTTGTIIANCYYSGSSVSGGTNTTGGVCGGVINGTATITNSYYDSTVLTGKKAVGGTDDITDVKGLPTTDMKAASGETGALVDLLNGYEELNNSSIVEELKNWTVSSGSYPLFTGMTLPVTDYGITVNDIQVKSANASDVLGDGKVSYDPTNNKLSVGAISGNLIIVGNNTVDIKIDGGTSLAVSGALTVTRADDVTVTSECTGGPVISSGANITCTGDVTITAHNGHAISGNLKVEGAENVTVKNESPSAGAPAITAADITCTGDVTIYNAASGSGAISQGLIVRNAKNVTVTSATTTGASVIGNSGADITCAGDVTITAPNGPAINGNLTVKGAKNVTLKNESSSTTAPVITGTANITSSGDVLIQTSGSGAAVSGSITYARSTGAGGYLVKTGDTEASLTTAATKTESETYTSEGCASKIFKIVKNDLGTTYDVWVNGVRVTSANKDNILSDSGTPMATFDPDTNTLTLTNANITETLDESNASAAVYSTSETALKVVLVGNNTIAVTGTDDSGFYVENADLTLEGSGSLTVNAKKYGIFMDGEAKTITLGGSGKLEFTGEGDGISAQHGVTVVFSNTNSTPVSIVSSDQYGIWSNKDITLSGTGSANITAKNTAVYVNNEGDVTFSGSGNINLEGGHGVVDGSANGIYVQNGDVKFTGTSGQVSVKGIGNAIYLGPTGKKVYLNGSASPITLTAGSGYAAVLNSPDGSNVVTDTNSKYTVAGAPGTPSAVYTLKGSTYTVTVQNDGNGTASANPTSAAKDETVTLTATPNTGYHFKEWQSDDVTVSGNTFTMPEKNVTVKAIFEVNALTGTVSITGTAKYNETLTASVTDLTYTGVLSYQWKRGGEDISGATGNTYTLTADDIGKIITVTVTSSVETGAITSAATSAVEKADGPAAPTGLSGTACTTSANNNGKITSTTAAMEYSTDSTFASKTACTGTETTGLTNGTYYVRIAETTTHKAGAAAAVVVNAYVPVTYTVTFNPNGGSVTPASATTGTNGKLASLPIPTRWGYTFDGWYMAPYGGMVVNTDTVFSADTMIYAHWIRNKPVTPSTPFTPVTPTKPELPFTDAKKTDWSYEDIYYTWEKGLMNGTSATTFSPKVTTSRGMIVTILYRLEGEPTVSGTCPFTDVKSGSYYEKAITWAAANGIVGGYGNGKFGPDDPITREQMAAILYRYAKYKGIDVSVDANTNFLSFNDFWDIGEYAKPAMMWAIENKLIQGDNWNLNPQGSATREQVAAILHRFCENIVK